MLAGREDSKPDYTATAKHARTKLDDKREGGNNAAKKSAGVASLRSQGTPAYPARLRSERARNSSRKFSATSTESCSRTLVSSGSRKRCKFGPRIFPPQKTGRL